MAVTDKTIVLITGANQGIGASAATRLAKEHNFHVIIGSRSLEAGQKLASQLKSEGFSADAVQLDVLSDDSIAAATKYLTETYGHLDVLVNNAGILWDRKEDIPIRELYETTFATNVTGPAILTKSLLPLLRASTQRPRVIFLSSRMGSITESLKPENPWYSTDYTSYDASKAAVNILMANFSRILADKQAYVNSVCPQFVATSMTGYNAYGISPDVGAERVVQLASLTGKDCEVTGTFSDKDGVIPW